MWLIIVNRRFGRAFFAQHLSLCLLPTICLHEEMMMKELRRAYAQDNRWICEGCKEFRLLIHKNPAHPDSAAHLSLPIFLHIRFTQIVNNTYNRQSNREDVIAQMYQMLCCIHRSWQFPSPLTAGRAKYVFVTIKHNYITTQTSRQRRILLHLYTFDTWVRVQNACLEDDQFLRPSSSFLRHKRSPALI